MKAMTLGLVLHKEQRSDACVVDTQEFPVTRVKKKFAILCRSFSLLPFTDDVVKWKNPSNTTPMLKTVNKYTDYLFEIMQDHYENNKSIFFLSFKHESLF